MAAQPPPLAGSDGIRDLGDDDAIYEAFDAYPWTKDKTFLSGLSAILGAPAPDNLRGSPADMATHARIFYYAQRIGVHIDFARYQAWLARHPAHDPPRLVPAADHLARPRSSGGDSRAGQPEPPPLSWQQAAPKADLYVDRGAASHSASTGTTGGEPGYPMGFVEMLKLLHEGKPIPGMRHIPSTTARDPSVKPVGSRTAPRKPWEKHAPSPPPEMHLPKALDTEFPPLDHVQAPASPSEKAQPS